MTGFHTITPTNSTTIGQEATSISGVVTSMGDSRSIIETSIIPPPTEENDPNFDDFLLSMVLSVDAVSPRQHQRKKVVCGPGFTPGPYDVICARGKISQGHPGNHHLREITAKYVKEHSKPSSRSHRSVMVTNIINTLNGNFFKRDKETGQWIEASDLEAREKVGQCMRNALSSEFKSSFKNKVKRRKQVAASLTHKLHNVVMSDNVTRQKMQSLENVVLRSSSTSLSSSISFTTPKRVSLESTDLLPDKELLEIFKKNNAGMLEHFKMNESLVKSFRNTLGGSLTAS